MRAPSYVANFDSSTAMLRATAAHLRGEGFPALGALPRYLLPVAHPLATAVNVLPQRLRESIYTWSGWSEAVRPEKLRSVSAEEISRWVTGEYPRRRYPAVAIGSSNGALVHLCAALRIPWLPQTFLVPVRRGKVDVDDSRGDLAWGQKHGPALLGVNPDLTLHQMHDPNQDRLMLQRMAYFRVKRTRLGDAYERFLRETLPPGGTIFLVECQKRWPTTRAGERHIFQHGALGGATVEEFFQGGERVREYLKRYGPRRSRWNPPEPDGESPEAEWGFEPALREDVERLAREGGYRLRRVIFEDPEDISPLVADLHRWWYERSGHPADRLLVETFILIEPRLALQSGSVPLWTTFNTEPSLGTVERYLGASEPFEEIYATLFSHGVESVGLPAASRWRTALERAGVLGSFAGVDEQRFPQDYATFARYHAALRRIPSRPAPERLSLEEFNDFLEKRGDRYAVEWP